MHEVLATRRRPPVGVALLVAAAVLVAVGAAVIPGAAPGGVTGAVEQSPSPAVVAEE